MTAPDAPSPAAPAGSGLGPRLRSAAIVALLGVLVAGQAYAMITRSEPWPFSSYPMYHQGQGRQVTTVQVEGVLEDGTRQLLAIQPQLAPFAAARLRAYLRRLGKGARGEARRVQAARALLSLYESHRSSGRHSGPPLRELEVFEATWRIVPFATNRERPKSRRLVASTLGRRGGR